MARNKPLTYQEKKILVYNKMKHQGLTHDEAWKEVHEDIASCIKNSKKADINVPANIKEEFKKVKHGKGK